MGGTSRGRGFDSLTHSDTDLSIKAQGLEQISDKDRLYYHGFLVGQGSEFSGLSYMLELRIRARPKRLTVIGVITAKQSDIPIVKKTAEPYQTTAKIVWGLTCPSSHLNDSMHIIIG